MTCTCHATPGRDPLLAAAVGPLDQPFPVPAYPPADWFHDRPDWLTPDTKISVDDEGRVAGYFYNAGQCLVHNHGACPSPSPTGYSAFHQQHVATADGELALVGVIGNVNGHANEYAPVSVAQAHYADPDAQLIECRAYDDEHGGFILGSLVPHATHGDVALIRRSALSGDWRPMPPEWFEAHGVSARTAALCEYFDCIGPTLVTRPGLPLVRRFAAAILGGCGGIDQGATMEPTTIELPDGTKITTPPAAPAVAPGPHPVPAAQAAVDTAAATAAPGDPMPPAADDQPSEDGDVAELKGRVDALESAVEELTKIVMGDAEPLDAVD